MSPMMMGNNKAPLLSVKMELDGGSCKLLQFTIAPGTSIPPHSRVSPKLTLVRQGSYGDEIGRLRPGKLASLRDAAPQQPIADTAEPCLCLIATDDKLKFPDGFSRMRQPLVGI